MIDGLPVIVSPFSVRRVRLFPDSRHRSKRIWRKLVRRHGAEYREVPAAFRTPAGLVLHPDLLAALDSNPTAREASG